MIMDLFYNLSKVAPQFIAGLWSCATGYDCTVASLAQQYTTYTDDVGWECISWHSKFNNQKPDQILLVALFVDYKRNEHELLHFSGPWNKFNIVNFELTLSTSHCRIINGLKLNIEIGLLTVQRVWKRTDTNWLNRRNGLLSNTVSIWIVSCLKIYR